MQEPDLKPKENRDRLIVALDTANVSDAKAIVDELAGDVTFYKIGLELVTNGGMELAQELCADGCRVFLDMKFLDIGNTVERAVANVARSGVSFLTIHGTDTKTLSAAVAGAAGSDLGLLAVTVLTNLSEADLEEQGLVGMSPSQLVIKRALLAKAAGCRGVIASGREAAAVRAAAGDDLVIVTPGIRLPDDDAGDQSRITTPGQAIKDGADYIVVGRPITQADDRRAAAARVFESINQA